MELTDTPMELIIGYVKWRRGYDGDFCLRAIYLKAFDETNSDWQVGTCTILHIFGLHLPTICAQSGTHIVILPTALVAHLREFCDFVEVARFDGSLVATQALHPDWESFLARTIPTVRIALPDPPPYGESDLVALLDLTPQENMDSLEGVVPETECITSWPTFEKPRSIRECKPGCNCVVIYIIFDERDAGSFLGPSHPRGGRLTEDACLLVARPAVAARLMQSGRFCEIALAEEWASFLAAARLRWSPWLSSD